MLKTTIGQLLVNRELPAEHRDYDRVINKDTINDLLKDIAEKYPEKYGDILKGLGDVGRQAAYTTGGQSFGLEHLKTSIAAQRAQLELKKRLRVILSNKTISDEERNKRILTLAWEFQKKLPDEVYNEALGVDNPLARQIAGPGRGNKSSLNSIIGADLLYVDHRDEPIPLPVLRNYSQGLSPAEYFAGAFGARRGLIDLKQGTADAGYLCLHEKTLVRMADWSVKMLRDIRVDDLVMGADSRGYLSPTRVTAVFDQGLQPCYRYQFRVGKARAAFLTIEATDAHKVLAKIKRGRITTKRGAAASVPTPTLLPLRRASAGFSLVPRQGYKPADGDMPALALLIGLLLGDGGISGATVYFSNADPLLLSELAAYLQPLDFILKPRPKHAYEYSILDAQRAGPGYRNRLHTLLRDLDLKGKLAHEKHVPTCITTWCNQAVAALIAGVFATDGTVSLPNTSPVPYLSLTLTSRRLVTEIRELLADRFGIHCPPPRFVSVEKANAAARRRGPGKVLKYVVQGKHDGWVIVINDYQSVQRFAAQILLPGQKRLLLAELLARCPAPNRDSTYAYSFVAKQATGFQPTRDIEVAHPDHMFLLANGAIVSNSKQLVSANHRLLVSAIDDETPYNEHTPRGLPVATNDPGNIGALLSHPAGGYRRNTALTPKILKDLHSRGVQQLLVRSPLVGGPEDGGVYANDVGVREKGRIAPLGDYVGIAAANALGEKISQATISSKHSGGVAGATAGAVAGFKAIDALVQVPKTFPGGATHAQLDGRVQAVDEAPQGGYYVVVNGEKHYVHGNTVPTVKVGDEVEAGDTLSSGTPNPAEIVRHKGIGEGRRYFTEAMSQVLKNSGINAERRNVELLSRGLINHVRMLDEAGDYIPEDVVPYSMLERHWTPRPGTTETPLSQAKGRYLERPVLHYTIGTKIGKRVQDTLQQHGVKHVSVHHDPPPFEADMIRGMEQGSQDPDWMVRLSSAYQEKSLLKGVHRGAVSDQSGTSFIPSLAEGATFGLKGITKGWDSHAQ